MIPEVLITIWEFCRWKHYVTMSKGLKVTSVSFIPPKTLSLHLFPFLSSVCCLQLKVLLGARIWNQLWGCCLEKLLTKLWQFMTQALACSFTFVTTHRRGQVFKICVCTPVGKCSIPSNWHLLVLSVLLLGLNTLICSIRPPCPVLGSTGILERSISNDRF